MVNWKSWIWPGLATVACLTALAMWFRADTIEADLRKRALLALEPHQGWVQVSVRGRDLRLTGLAPDEPSRAKVLEITQNLYGVRVVENASGLLPVQSPYRLSAAKTESGVTLSGFVPNETTRKQVIADLTAMLPGIALLDQMKLARGAPAQLTELADFGLAAFSWFSTGAVEITDTVVNVSGQALNPEDHEAALTALSEPLPAGGILGDVEITPAAVSDGYGWKAKIDADCITLGGYAPSLAIRQQIADAAGLAKPGVPLVDEMLLATGVPDRVDWLAASKEAMSVLSHLVEGQASISGNVLDLSGQAANGDEFREVQQLLDAGFDSGLVLGTADIGIAAISPFEWSASVSDAGLVLQGFVPGGAIRARLAETAGLKFGTLAIDDRQKTAGGAPEGFDAAALVALQALSRLDDAEVRLVDRKLTLQGDALNPAALLAIERTMAEDLPEGYEADTQVAVRPVPVDVLEPASCQQRLDLVTGANSVLFDSAQANIQLHSLGFLDRIAFVANQCGNIRLEISGHTDSDGAEDANLDLSNRRATSVVDFLVATGVEADRLSAIGYGEDRPVAENGTSTGKAANRRIEFQVLK
ncbi:OmpA family protein [Hoeflea sp. G2-23]|uniref:OmpA family protein n=1 Tax=Hoeflea algicola TaxID=2983763 RepID=A0ABT3Z7A2_9HYPH|nr:OmpA family protein [Hoeflea algicola]MCY0147642.1 OmpA family protein [Hoeflea algicola]